MKKLLEDVVSEESLEKGSSSYNHVSGMHVCELQGKYVVLSHNEYRDLKEKSKILEDLDIIKWETLEDAVKEVRNIVEYANSRGAVDARFIQKKRGSDYKVNSQSQEGNEETKKTATFEINKCIDINIKKQRELKEINNQNNLRFRVSSKINTAYNKVKNKIKNKLPVTVRIKNRIMLELINSKKRIERHLKTNKIAERAIEENRY